MALLPSKVDYLLELHILDRALDSDVDCPICQESYSIDHWPVRGHQADRPHGEKCVFGHTCLAKWALENHTCPLCRGELYSRPDSDRLLEAVGDAMDLDSVDNDSDEDDSGYDTDDTFVAIDNMLPRIWSVVQSARSTSGCIWYTDVDTGVTTACQAVSDALQQRAHAYRAGKLLCDPADYARYQRATPGMWRGLPTQEYPLDVDELQASLFAPYFDSLTGYEHEPIDQMLDFKGPYLGWTCRSGSAEDLRRAPVAAHPAACTIMGFINKTLGSMDGRFDSIEAPFLEEWVWDAILKARDLNGNLLFNNFSRRCRGDMDLPAGLDAWVTDMIEVLLMALVGPDAAQGPKKGVARLTVDGVKAQGWYEPRKGY